MKKDTKNFLIFIAYLPGIISIAPFGYIARYIYNQFMTGWNWADIHEFRIFGKKHPLDPKK